MADPTLDQLQVFVAAAEAGGFSAAARRLNRTQSVISYTIANLEAQLDLRLFQRAGTRVPRLTPAGRALLADARRLAADLRTLQARARGLRQGLEGELRLAVDPVLPMPVLTTAVRAFAEQFPTVPMRLLTGTLGTPTDLVLRRAADLGVAGETASAHPDVVGRPLGRQLIRPVAAPDHPLSRAEPPVPAATVREHVQIVVTDVSERTRGRDFHVHAFDTWRVTDFATKHALLLAGLGWGGLPTWMVADDLAAGRLVDLTLSPYPPTGFELHALHAADTPPGPAATWLLERFRAELADFADR